MLEGLYVGKCSLRVEILILLQKTDDEFYSSKMVVVEFGKIYSQLYTWVHVSG